MTELESVVPIALTTGLVSAYAVQVMMNYFPGFAPNVDFSFRQAKSSMLSLKALTVL